MYKKNTLKSDRKHTAHYIKGEFSIPCTEEEACAVLQERKSEALSAGEQGGDTAKPLTGNYKEGSTCTYIYIYTLILFLSVPLCLLLNRLELQQTSKSQTETSGTSKHARRNPPEVFVPRETLPETKLIQLACVIQSGHAHAHTRLNLFIVVLSFLDSHLPSAMAKINREALASKLRPHTLACGLLTFDY